MTDDNSILDRLDDESRRSFMKKGAVATGGLALGVTGAAAQEETPAGETPQGEGGDLTALVFADDYKAGVSFQPVGQLQNQVTQNILQGGNGGDGGLLGGLLGGGGDEESIPNVESYQGYVIQYELADTADFAMLFVSSGGGGGEGTPATPTPQEGDGQETTATPAQGEGPLQQGQSYTLGGNATLASQQLNLLQVQVSQGSDGGATGGTTETPEEGATETPGEGITETPGEGATETPGEGATETPEVGLTQTPEGGGDGGDGGILGGNETGGS